MRIIIRKANQNDLDSILDIYAQPSIDNGMCLPIDDARQILKIIESYPDYSLYVAENEGEVVVGTFALLIMDNIGHMGRKSALLESVAVQTEFQGRGIGTEMIKYAFGLCHEKKCYKVCLSADIKREKAHEFYKSLGLIKHGYSFKLLFDNQL